MKDFDEIVSELDKLSETTEDNVRVGDILCCYSPTFQTDKFQGVCEDGDSNCVRYWNIAEGAFRKMKAGKFFRHIMLDNGLQESFDLTEGEISSLCESFAYRWACYQEDQDQHYELHVDDDFERIYRSGNCVPGIGSCMFDCGYWTFYQDAVDAQAAYITDKNGLIAARCVIFNNVRELGSEKVFRLAERQYAPAVIYKAFLVKALIREGYIDGYKGYLAGCADVTKFFSNDGEDWSQKKFYIHCHLDYGDTLSYQDSFKWFSTNTRLAYNYSTGDEMLDDTSGVFGKDDENYDEYTEESVDEDVYEVQYEGRTILTTEANRDADFTYIDYKEAYYHNDICLIDFNGESALEADCESMANGEYVLRSEASFIERSAEWVPNENAVYSDYSERDEIKAECTYYDDWIHEEDVEEYLEEHPEFKESAVTAA